MSLGGPPDAELDRVHAKILQLDPDGSKIANVLRETLDQLYDGQNTGRYRWDQLYKTEKTHCGTLVEINLHRQFAFENGQTLDYRIADVEVDCKYSQRLNGWMIPPEAHGHLCILLWAQDETASWKMGIVRATPAHLSEGRNRDGKATLSEAGRNAIRWIFPAGTLLSNVLLHLGRETVDQIMALDSGQKRVNELFRRTLGQRVSRTVVATVAMQDDPMKRVRENGGARSALRKEGIVILGQYENHVQVARALEQPEPGKGDSVPLRLAPATPEERNSVEIDGRWWKIAREGDPPCVAPIIPTR